MGGSPARSAVVNWPLYATVAVQAVVPDDLGKVPAEKIVQVRQVLSEEFQAFRAHLDGLDEQFAQLGDSEDEIILKARVREMVK